jgi:ubiquinone/menaquinone biosynthesis C-methylase UbiE
VRLHQFADGLRRLRGRVLGLGAPNDLGLYAARYERHARRHRGPTSVGGETFELVGLLELGLLQMEGLKPDHTLVDIGCGVGRLAQFVIGELESGRYVGTDLSPTMLRRAAACIAETQPDSSCHVELQRQRTHSIEMDDGSVDFLCAFSVFTHVEHEDAYLQLVDAMRVCKPGGRMLFSCLPLDQRGARKIFLESASHNVQARWLIGPRSVVTSRDLMESIARLAGWRVSRWYSGDEANIIHPRSGEMHALGQSTCVLEKP